MMTDTEIPEDIREVADRLWGELFACVDGDGEGGCWLSRDESMPIIARAILAERKRYDTERRFSEALIKFLMPKSDAEIAKLITGHGGEEKTAT